MALVAKQNNSQEMDRVPAEVIPIPSDHDHRAAGVADPAQTAQEYGKRANQRITATQESRREFTRECGHRLHKAMPAWRQRRRT